MDILEKCKAWASNVINYSTLISASTMGMQPERALELFEAMQNLTASKEWY